MYNSGSYALGRRCSGWALRVWSYVCSTKCHCLWERGGYVQHETAGLDCVHMGVLHDFGTTAWAHIRLLYRGDYWLVGISRKSTNLEALTFDVGDGFSTLQPL